MKGIVLHEEVKWLLVVLLNQQNAFDEQMVRQSIKLSFRNTIPLDITMPAK
jgi:hypothetical protein